MKTIEILGFKAKVAHTFWERTRGLIGTKSLAPDEGLLIEKCNAIHMCFMSFPIDAYFLDKDDQVVKVVRNIPPWKLFVWGGRRATKVLETAVHGDSVWTQMTTSYAELGETCVATTRAEAARPTQPKAAQLGIVVFFCCAYATAAFRPVMSILAWIGVAVTRDAYIRRLTRTFFLI